MLWLCLLLLTILVSNSQLYTLNMIAKHYDAIRDVDIDILRSNGFPIEPNVCLISQYEQKLLYTLARYSPGNIIEEGSYCGCSTVFLAAGARDQLSFYDNGHSFITSDIFPAGIQNDHSPMRYTVINDDKVGLKIWDEIIFDFPSVAYNHFFDTVLNPNSIYKGSMLSCLYSQLFEQNLHSNVTIVAGGSKNIAGLIDYHLIWSDAAHDEDEINRNSLIWKKIARTSLSRHNVIFCFHDVGSNEKLIELVNNIFIDYNIIARLTLGAIYAIELSLKSSELSKEL